MTNLSPAAQAVLNAAEAVSEYGKATPLMKARLAAALRAAADQAEQKWPGFSHEACQEIRAIAAELQGQ
jgi:hypothetical protein